MAPQQTALALPADHQTLRFYLDGVHQFVQWGELQISIGMGGPISSSPGRLFLVFQGIIEPYVAVVGDRKEGTSCLGTVFPSVSSSEKPFEVTPAFLAIQPFLDREELLARLETCRGAIEAIGPIPSTLLSCEPTVRERFHRRIGKVKERGSPTAEGVESHQHQVERGQQPKLQDQREKDKIRRAVATVEGLLDPFRTLARSIIIKMAGGEGMPQGGQDDSAYVPLYVARVIDAQFRSEKGVRKFIKDNKIRTRRPKSKKGTERSQRLEVHAGDFLRAYREIRPKAIDASKADKTSDDPRKIPAGKGSGASLSGRKNPRSDEDDESETLCDPVTDERRQGIRRAIGLPETPYNARPED